jgi:hypothetical protein
VERLAVEDLMAEQEILVLVITRCLLQVAEAVAEAVALAMVGMVEQEDIEELVAEAVEQVRME